MRMPTVVIGIAIMMLAGYVAATLSVGFNGNKCVWTPCKHGWIFSNPPKFNGALKANYNLEDRTYNIVKSMWSASDHEASLREVWGNPVTAVTGFKVVTGATSGGDIEFNHPGKISVYKEIHVAFLYSGDGVAYPAVFTDRARHAFRCHEPYIPTEGAVW